MSPGISVFREGVPRRGALLASDVAQPQLGRATVDLGDTRSKQDAVTETKAAPPICGDAGSCSSVKHLPKSVVRGVLQMHTEGVCNELLTVGISYAKDEGGPFGFQEQVPNRSKLLRSKGVVVSVGSKVRMKFGQMSIRETSVSKPSVTRRKALDTAKTGGARILWDKSVGYLGTGQMAVGV